MVESAKNHFQHIQEHPERFGGECENGGLSQLLQKTQDDILLMEEIPNNHLECIKNHVNNGINYQPQLVIAAFLNHQQYGKSKMDHLPLCFWILLGQLDSQQRNHVKKNTFKNTVCFLEENP